MSAWRVAPLLFIGSCSRYGPAVYAEGLQALHDGSYRRAAKRLEAAFRSSRRGRIGLELAQAYALCGRFRPALRAAERAWKMGPRGSDAIEFAKLLPLGEAREAWFKRTIQALERSGSGRRDLAACAAVVREYEGSARTVIRACECARKRFGEFAPGKYLSGLGYELQGDLESAEREYRSSLEIDSSSSAAARRLGLLLARTGRKEEAVSLALRLLRSCGSTSARLAAGEVASKAGQTRLAEEVLERVLARGGRDAARAAALLSRAHSPRDKLAFLVDARSGGLDSPELRLELARACSLLGSTADMAREGREALERFPGSPLLARGLAELGRMWGEGGLAEAALSALGPRGRAALAEELARSGKGKEALRVARSPGVRGSAAEALTLASCGKVRAAARMLEEAQDPRSLHELAWLKLALGQLEEALRLWRSVLAIDPAFGPAEIELSRWKNLRAPGIRHAPGGGR